MASDDPAIVASKQAYRRFLLEMWRHFREIQPIDAVVSANFGYFAQRSTSGSSVRAIASRAGSSSR